jgi:hypothetical protein
MDNGCTHAGEVWIGGKMWTVTAKVVETPDGRQFQGDVQAPGEAIRQRAFPGDPKGDLVSQAAAAPQELPFNDKLPPF